MSWRLVIDTATRRTVVAVGEGNVPAAAVVLDTRDRHGARLLPHLESVLAEAGIGMADIERHRGGHGPGSFTGLRVGLATAKTLSAIRHLPLVGLATDEVLRRSPAGAPTAAVVVLPAGARDHYLGLPGSDPVLVPPGADLESLVGDRPIVAVDVAADASWLVSLQTVATAHGLPDPLAFGRAACEALPGALLDLLDRRLAQGDLAEAATLVPRYVALPRGIPAATAAAADALGHPGSRGGDMVARLPLTLRIEPMTRGRHRAGPRHRAGQLPGALAVVCLPAGARDQPHGALPGVPCRGGPGRLWRHVADGR